MGEYSGIPRCSTFDRMQQSFWNTRQTITKKLGKVDDECIVASDFNLDSKLELLNTTIKLLDNLLKVLEFYQRSLKNLWKRKAALGTFLRESGTSDATDAGYALRRVGEHMRSIIKSQKHLTEDIPNLHGDVDTFTRIAFRDVFLSVNRMESARISYRGCLMWMKHATKELDPDQPKTMKKFRKIQRQVKSAKSVFERLKVETMQKIDMLMASKNHLLAKFISYYQLSLISSFKMAHRMSKDLLYDFGKTYPHCIIFKKHKDGAVRTSNEALHRTSDNTADVSIESASNKKVYGQKIIDNFMDRSKDLKDKEDIEVHGTSHEPSGVAAADLSYVGDGIPLIDFKDAPEYQPLNLPSNTTLFPSGDERSLSKRKDTEKVADNPCLHCVALELASLLPSKSLEDHPGIPGTHQLSKDIDTSCRFFPSQLSNDDDCTTEDGIFNTDNESAETLGPEIHARGDNESNMQTKDNRYHNFLLNWDPLLNVDDNDHDGKC